MRRSTVTFADRHFYERFFERPPRVPEQPANVAQTVTAAELNCETMKARMTARVLLTLKEHGTENPL